MMIETDDLTITVERQSDEFRIVFTTKVAWTRTISPWMSPDALRTLGFYIIGRTDDT
jgi:hypothetical protein